MQLTRCFASRLILVIVLPALAVVLLWEPSSVLAGKYGPQQFTFANGTVPGSNGWNDGVVLSSPLVGDPLAPMASVRTNMLRMTVEGVSNAASSLKILDLDPGQELSGFTASFLVSMTAAGTPGNGFSVNFGDIPEGDGDGELGYALGNGLSVGFSTLVDVANGQTQGEITVYANRLRLAAFPQTFLYDGTKTNLSINWDAQGLDIVYAGVTVADNFPVPGLVPHVGDRFAISARTGDGASQEMSLDTLQVITKPVGNILTGGFIISEFVANNQNSLEDDDLQSSDWIEIYNGGTNSTLNGWYLTNVKTNLALWPFPSLTVFSNQYRLVFASGKDRRATNAQLHASFTLQREGGYLALVRPDLTIASEYTYGPQKQDVAYGEIGASRERGYLETPTPGKKNISAVADGPPAEDVTYSREGGLLASAAPVALSIFTPAAPNAEVRYTRDNTIPTELSRLYGGPFSISNQTTIRSRVFVPGRLPGKVSSRTFLKLDASLVNFAGTGMPFSSSLPVLVFDSFGAPLDVTTDPGGSRPFRLSYGVVIDTDPQTGRSSVTNAPDFVGRSGTHVRGESSSGFGQKSYAWEVWDENNQDKNASILGLPAESDWVLHGPWSDLCMMRNYLVFSTMTDVSSVYAGSRTRFVEVFFNQEANQPVSYADYRGVFLLVEKIKRSKNRVNIAKMNPLVTDPALITGGYIYKTDKNSPGSTAWATGRGVSMQSHDPEAFSAVQTKYLKDYVDNFEKALYGADPGNPVTGYPAWIDVPAFIDSQWWIEIAKQVDAYVFSTYYHKDRGGKMRTGPLWDFNIALGNANYATGDTPTGWLYAGSVNEPLTGGLWYPKLQADPEYRLQHWDRYWELRQGVWSTDSIFARIDAATALLLDGNSILISNNMPATVQSPAARQYRKYPILAAGQWPNPAGFQNRRTFQSELDYMKSWLSERLLWIDDQNQGGLSILRPPLLSQPGGLVPAGYPLALGPYSGTPPPGKRYPEGTIYYTMDGSDPRPPAYGSPVVRELVLVPEYQQATYFVPTADNGGPGVAFADWTSRALGPTAAGLTWTTGRLGLGFDDSASTNYFHIGGGDYAQGDIRAAMQGKSSTVFIRVPFSLSLAQVQQVLSLKLKMRSDDAVVAYLNGVLVGRYNLKATNNPAWDTVPNNLPGNWSDSEAVKLREIALTNAVSALRPGENILAILGINASASDDDALFSPVLSATILEPPNSVITSQPYSAPIPIHQTTTVKTRLFYGGFWSPITTATFVVGAVPASSQNLVVSEIMYHPAPPTAAEAKVSSNASDYEFLEFLNTSAAALDLSQVRLANAVVFNFSNGDPAALVLPAGGRVVVCANLAAFQARYGTNNPAIRLAGVFTDNLGNGGETLTVLDRHGEMIWSFAYSDKEPWPVDADGAGYSIVLNRPTSHPTPDPALGANWRSSAGKNGAPGQPDAMPFTLDPFGDLDGDGLLNFLEYATGSDPAVPSPSNAISAGMRNYAVNGAIGRHVIVEFRRNLRAADVTYELQTSSNLRDWSGSSGDLVYVGTRNNGDGTATVTWRTALAMDQEPKPFLYVRLLVR